MFALLQIYPLEATTPFGANDDRDTDCGVDVLAVGDSRERLEQFAAAYERRHHTAHEEWQAWDDLGCEWDEGHDQKSEELERKYGVSSPSIGDLRWQIVEVWAPMFDPRVAELVA
jgi:hypothetical protein